MHNVFCPSFVRRPDIMLCLRLFTITKEESSTDMTYSELFIFQFNEIHFDFFWCEMVQDFRFIVQIPSLKYIFAVILNPCAASSYYRCPARFGHKKSEERERIKKKLKK